MGCHPAGQLLPEGFFGRSDKLKVEKYDPAGAKKLLAEAGYPNGFQVTLLAPTTAISTMPKSLKRLLRCLRASVSKQHLTLCRRACSSKRQNRGPEKPQESTSCWLVGVPALASHHRRCVHCWAPITRPKVGDHQPWLALQPRNGQNPGSSVSHS